MNSVPSDLKKDLISSHFLNGLKNLYNSNLASDRALQIIEIDETCYVNELMTREPSTSDSNSNQGNVHAEDNCHDNNIDTNEQLENKPLSELQKHFKAEQPQQVQENKSSVLTNLDDNESKELELQFSMEKEIKEEAIFVPDLSNETEEYTIFKECIPFCSMPVHSLVLILHSTYFKTLFSSGMSETNLKDVTVKVKKGDGEYLQHLIHAFYDQDALLQLNKKDLLRVLEIADQFSCDAFINRCLEILETCIITSVQECNEIVDQLTKLQNHVHLLKIKYDKAKLCCINFLVSKFCPLENKEYFEHEEFQQLSYNSLLLLLQSKRPFAWDENSVLFYIAFWLDYDETRQTSENIKNFLTNLTYKNLNPEYLYDAITSDHQIFSKWEDFKTWFLDVIGFHSFAHKRKLLCQFESYQDFYRNYYSIDMMQGWKVKMDMSSPLSFVPDDCFSVFSGYLLCPRLFLKKSDGKKNEFKLSLQISNSSVLDFTRSLLHNDIIGQEFTMAVAVLPGYENYTNDLFHRKNSTFIQRHFREVFVQLNHRTDYCNLDLGIICKDFLDMAKTLYVAMAFKKTNEHWPPYFTIPDLTLLPLKLTKDNDYSQNFTGRKVSGKTPSGKTPRRGRAKKFPQNS